MFRHFWPWNDSYYTKRQRMLTMLQNCNCTYIQVRCPINCVEVRPCVLRIINLKHPAAVKFIHQIAAKLDFKGLLLWHPAIIILNCRT